MKRQLNKIARGIPVIRHLIKIHESLGKIQRELCDLHLIESVRSFENEWLSNERFRDPSRLLACSAQINSQNGEDGMIAEVFRRIGTESKTFVELGLEDGRESNSAFLVACGWNGYWIDGGQKMHRTIDAHADLKSCIKALTAFITAENAGTLFEQLEVPQEFDLLSLDIDQNTYYVWQALTKYRPRVVVIEYNSIIPPTIEWKVNYSPDRVWDQSQNYGASLKSLELLGDQMGYKLIGCDFTGSNAFFVREDLVADHFAEPFTAENHYEPPRPRFVPRRTHGRAILDRPHAA